jgi:hypothetical protein
VILLVLDRRLQQMVTSGSGFAMLELPGSVIAMSASSSTLVNEFSSHRWR